MPSQRILPGLPDFVRHGADRDMFHATSGRYGVDQRAASEHNRRTEVALAIRSVNVSGEPVPVIGTTSSSRGADFTSVTVQDVPADDVRASLKYASWNPAIQMLP